MKSSIYGKSDDIKGKEDSHPIVANLIGCFTDRLRKVIGSESVRSFSRRSGVSESSIRNCLSGGGTTLESLVSFAVAGGCSVEWLATGNDLSDLNNEHAFVSKLEIEVSAGQGSDISGYEVVSRSVAFRKDWLRSKGLNEHSLALIQARGDSMEPTLPDGCHLLVDISDTSPGDGIYIVRVKGHLYPKRIQQLINGGVRIISDNKAYEPVSIENPDIEGLDIKGRVVWYGRDL